MHFEFDMCMINIFFWGGEEGVVDEEGGSSEGCLKACNWILKQGVGKGKSCS